MRSTLPPGADWPTLRSRSKEGSILVLLANGRCCPLPVESIRLASTKPFREPLFASISAVIMYNTCKAESMSELHRLFWETAMLDNDTHRDYLDQCRSSHSTCTLLTNIRRSSPACYVAEEWGIFMVSHTAHKHTARNMQTETRCRD
jgi:hypothetical protein